MGTENTGLRSIAEMVRRRDADLNPPPAPLKEIPAGEDALYLLRICVITEGGYLGPSHLLKKTFIPGWRALTLPQFGPFVDHVGKGIYGSTKKGMDCDMMTGMEYCIRKCIDRCLGSQIFTRWQVIAAKRNEVEPDPEGYIGAYRSKRIWVCFTGSKMDALNYYDIAVQGAVNANY